MGKTTRRSVLAALMLLAAVMLTGCSADRPGASIELKVSEDGAISEAVVLRGIEVTGSAAPIIAEEGWKAESQSEGQRLSRTFPDAKAFADGNGTVLQAACDVFASSQGYRPEIVSPFGLELSVSNYLLAKRYNAALQLADVDFEPKECLSCMGAGTGDCPFCKATGKITCDYCDGKKQATCSDCEGKGKWDCEECAGGSSTCEDCDGKGRTYDEFWEEWSDCWSCDGDGKNECYSCGGDGTQECSTCEETGKVDCPACEGVGSHTCERCGGQGQISCDLCGGTGEPSDKDLDAYRKTVDGARVQVALAMPGMMSRKAEIKAEPKWDLSGDDAPDGRTLAATSWVVNWPLALGIVGAVLALVAVGIVLAVRAVRKRRNAKAAQKAAAAAVSVAAPVAAPVAPPVPHAAPAASPSPAPAPDAAAPAAPSEAVAPAPSRFCTACGAANAADAAFCTACGNQFAPSAQDTA